MSIFKPATLSWPARIGVVAVVAAAGLVAVPSVASAAVVAPAVPATGAVGNWIQLTSPTANTFRDAGNVLKVANNGTTINPWAVQFSAAPCPTVAGAIPAATHTIPDVAVAGAALTASASNGFIGGTAGNTTDTGKPITGTGIPAAETVTVTNATTAALLTASGVTNGTTAVAIGAAAGPYWAQQAIAVSGTKLSVKVPAYLPVLANSAAYNICVYDVGAGPLAQVLATSTFKAFGAPTIISVSSTSGPNLGGNSVTVTGTGFSSTTKAYIGGVPLNNQTVNGQAVTGTAPAGQGTANITVVSDGGTVLYPTVYTYLDGLSVPLSMAPTTASSILDIFGSGFQDPALHFSDFAIPSTSWTVASSVSATDVLTTSAPHGLVAGDRIRLGTVTTMVGLTSGLTYWVKTGSGSSLTLSATKTGPTVDITGATGTITACYVVTAPGATFLPAVTFTALGNLVHSTSHGLSDGDVVRFAGITGNANVSNNTPYYVITGGATGTFQIALTPAGTPITLFDDIDANNVGWRGGDKDTHVVLALGAYNVDATPGTPGSPAVECTGVTVFSDNELICNLAAPVLADGSYQVALVDDLQTGPTRATTASSVSTFTSAAY